LHIKFDDFMPHVMVDLTMAIKARKQGVPMLAVKRRPEWIYYIGHKGLYQGFSREFTWHTQAMREHHPWSAEVYLDLMRKFLLREFGRCDLALASQLEFDREVVNALASGALPLRSWGRTVGALQRRNEFLKVISGAAKTAG
jgi:hypothetical protein